MPPTTPRILVADDEPQFRRALARLLSREGYEVELAGDAPEALALLGRKTFDLLIADVQMPGNDGLAVLREQSVVPVLIVTGNPTLGTAVESLRGAAVDYMSKPVSPKSLLERVAEGVERARKLRRLVDAERRLRDQLELVTSLRASLIASGRGSVLAEPEPEPEPSLPEPLVEPLSPREREVLLAFCATPNIANLARSLHISPHTVKNHLKAIYRKLGVSSQAELLARVVEAQQGEQRA